ncbi:MAG: DsbA family protein [Solirubrobacteraceae bacterium]
MPLRDVMGELISLSDRRAMRSIARSATVSSGFDPAVSSGFDPAVSSGFDPAVSSEFDPAVSIGFYYDLGCPFSYLAAERVERLLGETVWYPAPPAPRASSASSAGRGTGSHGRDSSLVLPRAIRADAERAAASLRLPLSWPERLDSDCTGLHRAAACASELGVGDRFALAALRLGFCGGFDLSDPAIIAEAAAAANLPEERCLDAALDPAYDAALDSSIRILTAAGVRDRPAVQIGAHFFAGRHAVVEAAAMRAHVQRATTLPAS